jgi:16S rRNA (guanine(527)-N(7))-methyltransferase RsmG
MRGRGAVREMLGKWGVSETSPEAARFSHFIELLQKWNARVNLTASVAWDALEPLFAEGIWAASLYPAEPVRHLDIGSGAGFPALPIRILRPQMELTMLEPRGKRAAFLETVCSELGLDRVQVINNTLLEYLRSGIAPPGWDIVSWKALRLGTREMRMLTAATTQQTQFWVFHGESLPFAVTGFALECKEPCPLREHAFLSIFRRDVSRETNHRDTETRRTP